jgi:predicted RNA methylase
MFKKLDVKYTKSLDQIIDYSVLRAGEDSNYSTELPIHMNQIVKIILRQDPHFRDRSAKLRILDMTANIGGFSLVWAKMFPQHTISSIELDKNTFDALRYNIKILNLHNIKPVCGDSSELVKTFGKESLDFIYIDPPWGGPDYKHVKGLDLFLGTKNIADVIRDIFDRNTTRWVFLKAPTNFNFQSLKMKYTVESIMKPNKLSPDFLLIILNNVI